MPVFRHLPVHDLLDVTHNFEQLESERATELRGLGSSAAVGAWTNPESFSAKLEQTTCQVRKEQGGSSVRFKSTVKAKEEVPAGTALFTLPVGFRPPAIAYMPAIDQTVAGGALQVIYVNTNGVCESSLKITVAHVIAFDSCTFHLT